MMGRSDGSSVAGGRKNEPDLRVGNNGVPYKGVCLKLREDLLNDLLDMMIRSCRPGTKITVRVTGDHQYISSANFAKYPYLVSGVNFFEETPNQKTKDGKPKVNFHNAGAVRPAAIKVDKRTIKVAGMDKGSTTQGHDDLGKRCAQLYEAAASFAKRHGKPSLLATNLSTDVRHKRCLRSAGASAPEVVGNKDILMVSKRDDGGFGSEGTSATHTTGGNHQSGTNLATNHKPTVIMDTGAEVNVTGDRAIFVYTGNAPKGTRLQAANGSEMPSHEYGYLLHDMFQMSKVHFCNDVGPQTLISGPQLDLLGFTLKFEGGTCEVRDPETGFLVGEGRLVDNKKYLMDYLKIPLDRVPEQVPNVEDIPVPDGPVGPLSLLTPLWTAFRTILRRFSALFEQAEEQAPRRPPV